MSTPTDLMYFGKLPSRGDFVRSPHHANLIDLVDRWQSQTMERLSADPRWKLTYDSAHPIQFAVLGTGSNVGLAGYWMASQDASGRRFPFVTAASFDLTLPTQFASLAPIALWKTWSRLEQVSRVAHAATDFAHAQASLHAPMPVNVNLSGARVVLQDFLDTHTVASLEQMLASGCGRLVMRQAILALGLLLQPAMTMGASRLTRVLRLPLPADAGKRGWVAAWWLSLILGFFARHEIELGVYLTVHADGPQLLLGFQGASAATLHAVMDPVVLSAQSVSLQQSEWVEGEVQSDHGVRKLSNYLLDPSLSLAQALSSFQEVFLGV
ncbi:type VI secretion system-associated protein TagF [Aquabacterium sp.]|uniref:type VI secretion system-associated protein TagF n=1 Tax=Aquabacterium sp. TaxID=1872578 RepID=UPI003BF50179